jgi:hypothetical protein
MKHDSYAHCHGRFNLFLSNVYYLKRTRETKGLKECDYQKFRFQFAAFLPPSHNKMFHFFDATQPYLGFNILFMVLCLCTLSASLLGYATWTAFYHRK